MKKRIAIIIAFKNFRDEEFLIPYHKLKDIFDIDVYSSDIGIAIGKLGARFQIVNHYKNLNPENYDLILFVGGPGGYNYLGDATIKKIIISAYSSDKLLAAICMAPLLIAEQGLLKNKNATVFSGDKDKLTSYGASYTAKAVEISGNIITADGPASADAFADTIIQQLNNKSF